MNFKYTEGKRTHNNNIQPSRYKPGLSWPKVVALRADVLRSANIMNKTNLILILGIILVSCGCAQSKLKLSGNKIKDEKIIREYIPLGTLAKEGIMKMERARFTCSMEVGRSADISKRNKRVEQTGPMDFVWCDKKKREGLFVIRRWQVILILDQNDRIKNYIVTTGLIGP